MAGPDQAPGTFNFVNMPRMLSLLMATPNTSADNDHFLAGASPDVGVKHKGAGNELHEEECRVRQFDPLLVDHRPPALFRYVPHRREGHRGRARCMPRLLRTGNNGGWWRARPTRPWPRTAQDLPAQGVTSQDKRDRLVPFASVQRQDQLRAWRHEAST